MSEGNGNVNRGLPAVDLTVDQQRDLGMLEQGPPGKLRRRADLDFGQHMVIPADYKLEVSSKGPEKYQEAMRDLGDQLLANVGAEVMKIHILNPQARLIAVPYNIRSLRHDVDMRVRFWELAPDAKGVWGNGMKYIESRDGEPT